MTTSKHTSVAIKLLGAAMDLTRTASPFSVQALVIAAWRAHPDTFGLKGYERQSASDNKVIVALSGSSGMVARGWLSRDGDGLIAITQAGRKVLELDGAPSPKRRQSLSINGHDRFLVRAMGSAALRKFSEDKQAICFVEALSFWGVTEGMLPGQIAGKLLLMRDELSHLERYFESHEIATISSGRAVTVADVRVLGHLHEWLEGKFANRLKLEGVEG